MTVSKSEAGGGEPTIVEGVTRDASNEGHLPSGTPAFLDENEKLVETADPPSPTSCYSAATRNSEGKMSENSTTFHYGFQLRGSYTHSKKCTDIMAMTYNGRMHQFIMMDTKGITAWNKDAVNAAVTRPFSYPKYEYRLFKDIIYVRKHNVYFALSKDFSLKVLNRDFKETCSSVADLRSVLFMTFNSVRDELITGGVDGTRIWKFKQASGQSWGEIRAMANYFLSLERHVKSTNDRWVRKVVLEQTLQHLYYCCDRDLICYHMGGSMKPVFTVKKAHKMSITGCCYSASARLLVTSSIDCEVKAWSMTGGLIQTFRGHAKSVTDVLTHPEDSSLVISCSLDGTARTWSLNTMTCVYTLQVSSDGVHFMGLTDDKLLYLGTGRSVTVWSVNMVTSFWAHSRSQLSSVQLVQGSGKSTRLVAVGDDTSVRVFSRPSHMNLSTVLPPPSVSPLEKVKEIIYNRVMNIVYVLINERDLWLYTTRTDPSCRLMVWNLVKIQNKLLSNRNETDASSLKKNSKRNISTKMYGHRATEHGLGNEVFSNVTCIGCLDSAVEIWTSDGPDTPEQQNFLMLGLEDGRILFMNPIVKGQKIFEFRATKDSIKNMKQDYSCNLLVTLSSGIGLEHFYLWSLPSLELMYAVSILQSITHYAFLSQEECLMTGHQDGTVLLHQLVRVDDQQPKTRVMTNEDESGNCEHNGPITSVDACPERKIFLTCSVDGILKIWDSSKTLLTEINLDSSLSCACFLNAKADVVIGFHNQIFFIDCSKVYPSSDSEDNLDVQSDIESEIHEDPAVLYEGVQKDDEPANMKNYLCHFKKDIIDSHVTVEETFQMENDGSFKRADSVPLVSPAPTEIYKSRQSTPSRLSEVDLKLSAHLRHEDVKDFFEDGGEFSEDMKFEMPQFGLSPGPTPSPSTPSTPRTPTSIFDVSEEGESTETELEDEAVDDEDVKVPASVTAVIEKPKEEKIVEEISKPPVIEEKDKIETPIFEVKSRASGIVIDAATVLKEEAIKVKKTSVGKMSEPSQSVGSISVPPSSQGSRASSAARIKKKQHEGPRRRPKGKEMVDPEQILTPEPPKTPPEAAVEKRVPVPKRRTKGFLERESEAEMKEKEAAAKLSDKKSYEFHSRRHEVDMSAVVEKLRAPSPATRTPTPPTVTTQDISFKDSPAVMKRNKMTGKKVRNRSHLGSQQRGKDDSGSSMTKLKPKTSLAKKRGKGKHENGSNEGSLNVLRKSKSEETSAFFHSDQQRGSTGHVVVLPTDGTPQRKLSNEAVEILQMSDAEDIYHRNRCRSVPLSEGGIPPQFDTRCRTPAFLMDDESEWTFLMDDTLSRIEQDEDRRARGEQSRSSTPFGGQRRPYTPADQLVRPSRPHLEHIKDLANLSHGDMEINFAEELQKYRGVPGTEDYIDSLHKNDGLYFDNSWHEKAIMRHILLKLQRQLRAKGAAEKRKKVDAEKLVQQTKLSYHRDCSTPGPYSVPEHYDVEWKRKRAHTAPTSKGHRMPQARPNTAVSITRDHGGAVKSESAEQPGHLHRKELRSEQPFRLRLNLSAPVEGPPTDVSAEEIDLHAYDPRNTAARAFLLNPSKSIPSKCSRYILVTPEDWDDTLLATPLEERLIEERFPELYGHWIHHIEGPRLRLRPHRPSTAF